MSKGDAWREYLCKACGYIYNEGVGDEDGGLPPGTRYEDIPDDWYCPICGVTKADFVLVETRNVRAPISSATSVLRPSPSSNGRLSNTKAFDVVIVGGGTAAWAIVEALRRFSSTLSIAMIAQCDAHRYDKPLLSVAIARGLAVSDLIKERGFDAAKRLDIALYSKTTAVSIHTARNIVRTTLGSFHYQHLVLAQGAQTHLPEYLPPQYCWRVNHLTQYTQFRAVLGTAPRRVLVVGAGLIGSEIANDLALGGHAITLVDVAERPLERVLKDPSQSAALLKAWEKLTIEFLGQTEVLKVEPSVEPSRSNCYEIHLSHERRLMVDAVLVATGLRTCDRLAKSAGLNWSNGIKVDPTTLMTSAEGIYALGDCISINGSASRFIEPIARQALTVASQIVGDSLIPYKNQSVPIRIKTTALPMTV